MAASIHTSVWVVPETFSSWAKSRGKACETREHLRPEDWWTSKLASSVECKSGFVPCSQRAVCSPGLRMCPQDLYSLLSTLLMHHKRFSILNSRYPPRPDLLLCTTQSGCPPTILPMDPFRISPA